MRITLWIACLFFLVALATSAQTSPSYSLTESTVNNGGDPGNGLVPASATYRITLDAIGDTVSNGLLTSASYSMDVGTVSDNMPAGEAQNLRFSSKTVFTWDAERSVGAYNTYRGTAKNDWPCLRSNLGSATDTDAALPSPGQVFYYLVTAENRLGQEGTLGKDSTGASRSNAHPCP